MEWVTDVLRDDDPLLALPRVLGVLTGARDGNPIHDILSVLTGLLVCSYALSLTMVEFARSSGSQAEADGDQKVGDEKHCDVQSCMSKICLFVPKNLCDVMEKRLEMDGVYTNTT